MSSWVGRLVKNQTNFMFSLEAVVLHAERGFHLIHYIPIHQNNIRYNFRLQFTLPYIHVHPSYKKCTKNVYLRGNRMVYNPSQIRNHRIQAYFIELGYVAW